MSPPPTPLTPPDIRRDAALLLSLGALAFAIACADEEPDGPPTEATLISAREIGLVDQPETIQGRDGGDSTRIWGRTLFAYGDTVLNLADAEGTNWHHNSFSFTEDTDASDGIGPLTAPTDTAGAPLYLVPPTPDEATFNADHLGDPCPQTPCGARFAVWPGAPVWDEAHQRGILLYGLIYAEPGPFNFHGVGQSIALWTDPDAPVERPVVAPDAEHPTLIWGPDELAPTLAPHVIDDHLQAFACHDGGFEVPCALMRAPLDRVLEHDAWTFWDGQRWSPDPRDAVDVLHGNWIMSIHHNAWLDRYIAVYAEPLSNNVVLRTAPALQGPWSRPMRLFVATHGPDTWAYDAQAHPAFDEDGGRVIYVTWSRPTGDSWFGARFPLVRVELGRP